MSWVLTILGAFVLTTGIGYFVAAYISEGGIYWAGEVGAIIQVLLGLSVFIYGIKRLRAGSKGGNET
jgi:uncharacterized membrane protein YgaE (UPF0421/DUF939 family)